MTAFDACHRHKHLDRNLSWLGIRPQTPATARGTGDNHRSNHCPVRIFKWLSRERTSEEATLAITFTGECRVQDLTSEVAIMAAELSVTHRLHATDSIIVASAQMNEAKLISCDAHFRDVAGVLYIPKE